MSKYVKSSNDTTGLMDNSLFITTDKLRYMMGESVIVSGITDSNVLTPINKKVMIQLEIIPNSSKEFPGWVNWVIKSLWDKKHDRFSHLVYNASFYTNKTSFSETILNTLKSGTYQLSPTLSGSNEKSLIFLKLKILFQQYLQMYYILVESFRQFLSSFFHTLQGDIDRWKSQIFFFLLS